MVAARKPIAIHWSSKEQEQLTPSRVLRVVDTFWPDGIGLDPCGEGDHPGIRRPVGGWTVPALCHYTRIDDGLRQSWNYEHVFCNPPYKSMRRWVVKALAEAHSLWKPEILLLCPARPGSAWWRLLREYPRCEISGRLHFSEAASAAPFPSAVVFISTDEREQQRFVDVFSVLGDVYGRMRPSHE